MKIQLNGMTLAYDTAGEGKPILFVHGYPLSRKIWEPQISGLAMFSRIVAPDLRGHGESDKIPGPYSVDLLADDCNNLLDTLGITQPVVIAGLSMGGYIALAFYRKYADRMSGLILTATRAGSDSPEVKLNRDKAIDLARSSGSIAIVDGMINKMLSPLTYKNNPSLVDHVREIMVGTSVEGIVGALTAMKDRPDSSSMLKSIAKPVLIIHGNEDQLIPVTEAIKMYEEIPNSELVTINEAGHLLNMEKPTMFNQAIQNFIKRC